MAPARGSPRRCLARAAPWSATLTSPPLYLERLKASLGGLFIGDVVVAPGEPSKSFPVLADVCGRLLTLGVERGDLVVALGGGVVGDLAGFAASILRRGVRFVQIPTTLLAQVNSSVGGKTGIDTQQGKNLIGAFHQPGLVLADIATLETLEPREFRSGYAEVMKYGLLGDAPFFAWLEHNWQQIFSGKGEARAQSHRHELPRQGGNRRGRRARGERHPRAAQSRPYVRPCA